MINKETLKAGIVIGIVASVILLVTQFGAAKFQGKQGVSFGISSMLAEDYIPYLRTNGGYYSGLPIQTTSTFTSAGLTNVGTFTQTGAVNITGATSLAGTTTSTVNFVVDGGFVRSNPNSTTTSVVGTTQTIFENDIAPGGRCYATLIFRQVSTVSAPATTTYEVAGATSTFPNVVPNVGDWCDIIIDSATGTPANIGQTWSFSGAGFFPQTATTSPGLAGSLTIEGGGSAVMRWIRRFDSNIIVQFLPYKKN